MLNYHKQGNLQSLIIFLGVAWGTDLEFLVFMEFFHSASANWLTNLFYPLLI